MAIRLVILDCDRTLWEHEDVSTLRLPLARIDDQTVRDTRGDRVRLTRARGSSWKGYEPAAR